ncbi:sporulation inhibitor of replication protein SirA [Bacillus canaveralius]|uniref:Sporulation inhibitor of replication protein SirA n=1 Tax=Bacillus canaveralius TaxID=1403243 RepID=A0A2N5GK47_9BACI|nr:MULTISPECIES: sporulation inhibitor of replication protein SirA [Bacillus]PLR81781.1 sporulation inhibitor of replication protein SirA [Bacillus canaveralius]PLR86216.1 sporulation inhibitor of replication protein SirA [Bacillus sp. V33-4]PLR96727.1 sporulation inhibitor of replication protein SirA [Bacillus canaveralius]RSK49198.1 sporulation inhibitor of replication protein SirA [Bacillus canaveralius]
MRNYSLYLIEDEFACHYYGRERMFYELFKDYEQSHGQLRSILHMQIDYITKKIPAIKLHQLIHQQLVKNRGFRIEQNSYLIEKKGNASVAKLAVYDRLVTVESYGSFDSETIFFEVLRKCEHSFLAVDTSQNRYGWLKPIKERNFV